MNLNYHTSDTDLTALPEYNLKTAISSKREYGLFIIAKSYLLHPASSSTKDLDEDLKGFLEEKKPVKDFLDLISSSTRDFNIEPKNLLGQKESGSSTIKQSHSTYLSHKIEALFELGKDEIFEDGMESEFSKRLVSIVKQDGNDAIETISYFINYQKVNTEVASEALRWLGQIAHPRSYGFRLWLLKHNLKHPKARVRDGAVLGLSFLNDPIAIPELKLAIEQEKCTELREDMEQVLAQLESVSAVSLKKN